MTDHKKVAEAILLYHRTPIGLITDADTILRNILENNDESDIGLGEELLRIWLNSEDKESIEAMFLSMTGVEFEVFVDRCLQETTKQDVAILFTLVRRRPSENQTWVDNLWMQVPPGFDPADTEELLRKRTCAWLATHDGWKANCSACHDFNWGDFVSELPKECEVYSHTSNLGGAKTIIGPTIEVNQDELLAYDVTCRGTVTFRDADGKVMGTAAAAVDFQEGTLTYGHDADEVMFDSAISAVILLENGQRFALDSNAGFGCLELSK